MFRRIVGGTAIVVLWFETMLLGYKAGKSAANDEFRVEQLKRENEELKEQLKSQKTES